MVDESVFPAGSRVGHYHSEMRCVRVEVVQALGKYQQQQLY